jgi:hypothetical protein
MDKNELLRAKASAPVNITTYLTGWDTCDILDWEKKYRMEEDDDTKNRLASGELTEDDIDREIYNDPFVWDQAFEDLTSCLTEEIKKISPSGYFKASVTNFGWRNLDGKTVFYAKDGKEFLNHILPRCDCTYKIFKVKHGKALAISNSHHDQPIPYKEWYVVRPCSYRTYEQFKGR